MKLAKTKATFVWCLAVLHFWLRSEKPQVQLELLSPLVPRTSAVLEWWIAPLQWLQGHPQETEESQRPPTWFAPKFSPLSPFFDKQHGSFSERPDYAVLDDNFSLRTVWSLSFPFRLEFWVIIFKATFQSLLYSKIFYFAWAFTSKIHDQINSVVWECCDCDLASGITCFIRVFCLFCFFKSFHQK